ncbi:hypothetical protein B296_00050919 [Ensete ventricosum]|uniref:Uncharacterized protein n=1 Tax=Ensete ventricosum TaxID=4639 RepID=A0A426YJ89_ENSVE|nr:hypothetical protein B296_00050919 [Ensete ventricosum]
MPPTPRSGGAAHRWRSPCPWAAPRGLASTMPEGDAPVWARHGRCPCGLVACGRTYKCLAIADHSCKGPSRGRPPPFLATVTTKMQQERI